MLNLTPHDITIKTTNGDVTIAKSGTIARVETKETVVGVCPITGVDIIKREFGDVIGLPTDDSVIVIVSAMVLEACKGMKNVFAPDTGSTAIRNEKGHVIAVTRLVAAS